MDFLPNIVRRGTFVAKVELVDVSIRDGNQSLWGATGLSAQQVIQIAPTLDRIGFRALDYSSSTAMGVSVRNFQENPWERLRATRKLMPNTSLQFIGTGFRFISWETAHPDFMQLVYDRLTINGMDRVVVLDPMHDMEAAKATAKMLRKAGIKEIVGALVYTISEVHDDKFYSNLAKQMAECPDIDRVYVKDPAGLLNSERAKTLLPAIRAQLKGKALELHSHTTLSLSPVTYTEVASLVDVLQVAIGPLASGSSLPNAERVVANLRELGHTVDIDDHALGLASKYFYDLAEAEGLPIGTPQEYDAAFLRHQVAGGVMSTTRRQLRELGMEDRFPALMEEVGHVRAELGHPIMVTPFPQMVCSQALFNVIGTERYENVPDQIIRYVQGSFGRPAGVIDQNIMDKILNLPRAKELAQEPSPKTPSELRKVFGNSISDEELLLRATMPADLVDAMVAKGPFPNHYNPVVRQISSLVTELEKRPDVSDISITKDVFSITASTKESLGEVATNEN